MMQRIQDGSPIRFGIVGLGTAGSALIQPVVNNPNFIMAAAADSDEETLGRFKADFPDAGVFGSADAIATSPSVDVVFVATPTHFHTDHVLALIEGGKHVVTEKPIATRLEDADRMIEAAERRGVILMVGQSFSYEAPIQEMRRIVKSGELGPLKMIHNWYFNDWIYRPRNDEELDTSLGGGVTFRQGSHQFDLIRLISGGMVRSVRAMTGRWDPARPAEGAHTVFLDFENGVVATAVYNGYDRFHSAELVGGVGEGGANVDLSTYASARMALRGAGGREGERVLKKQFRYGGARNRRNSGPAPNMPFYGLTVVSCELGDIRQSPDGLLVYGPNDKREVTIPKGFTGRDRILVELRAALVDGIPPVHSGPRGKANPEVCLAALESSRERKEIHLSHQVPVHD